MICKKCRKPGFHATSGFYVCQPCKDKEKPKQKHDLEPPPPIWEGMAGLVIIVMAIALIVHFFQGC